MVNTLPTPLHRTGIDSHIHNKKRLLPGLALVGTCPRCDVLTLAIVADCQGNLHWRRTSRSWFKHGSHCVVHRRYLLPLADDKATHIPSQKAQKGLWTEHNNLASISRHRELLRRQREVWIKVYTFDTANNLLIFSDVSQNKQTNSTSILH